MATNSDGGIVLSVSIDSSEVSSDMKKVVSEINKQVQVEAKNLKAVESVNQAKEKTYQQQAKTNQEVYKEVKCEYDALTAEQNLNNAKEKGAIVSAKKVIEEEKGYQSIVKSEIAENKLQQAQNATLVSEEKVTQEKEKSYQTTLQSQIKEQKLAQEIENSATAEAKKEKAMLDAQKKQQDLLIGEQKLKKATEDAATAQEKHKQAIINTEKAQKSLKNATNSVTTAIKKMATQLGIAFSIKQIINFSKEAGELASQTEAYLTRMSTLYGSAAQDVYDWANANSYALGMAKSTAYEAAAQYGNLFTTFASATESAQLSIDMLQATAVVASQTGRTYEETFEKIQSGIYGNTRAIDDLGISVRQSSLMQTQAWQTVSQNGAKAWNDLTDAELQQLRVLGIIEQSTAKYGNTVMQTTALTRAQFNAAWTDFKATWGSVINGVLIPVLNVLTKIISAITVGLSWIAKFMGKSLELGKTTATVNTNTGGMADNIGAAADNQDALTDSVKGTNKELKKTLAGFDELQILQGNDDGGSGSGGGSGGAGGGGGGATLEVEDTGDVGGSGHEPDVSSWQSAIAGLVEVLVGVGFVALGIILCSMGHIALGVGAIAFGLLSIGVGLVTLGNAFDTSSAKELLLIVTGISGLLLLSIGVMLLYFGSKAWGIACIVGGVALLGYTAYELATGGMETEQIMSTLSTLLAFMGGALLAIGMFLIWIGGPVAKAWGIGCIIAGVASLVTAVATGTQGDLGIADWLTNLMVVAGGFLLVLGIMVLMTGFSPVGLGLVVAGVVVLGVALVNKSDAMSAETLAWINGIFAIVSAAALVIGIILCLTGVGIPLGIGLILVGAVGLATEVAVNWDFIKEKLQGVWEGISNFWNSNIQPGIDTAIGIIKGIWTDVIQPIIQYVVDGVTDLWENHIKPIWEEHLKPAIEEIGAKLNELWETVVEPVIGWIGEKATWLWEEVISPVMEWIGEKISWVWDNVLSPLVDKVKTIFVESFKNAFDTVKGYLETFFDTVSSIIDSIKDVFSGIITFITGVFTGDWDKALGGIKQTFSGMINGIQSIFKGAVNIIITAINGFIKGINLMVGVINAIPGVDIPKIPEIPPLAKGAVLPANKPFLAVVGDQKHGTNIEAPAELIKQMAMEAIAESNMASTEAMLKLLQQGFTSVCDINAQTANAIIATNANVAKIGNDVVTNISDGFTATNENVADIGQIAHEIMSEMKQNSARNDAMNNQLISTMLSVNETLDGETSAANIGDILVAKTILQCAQEDKENSDKIVENLQKISTVGTEISDRISQNNEQNANIGNAMLETMQTDIGQDVARTQQTSNIISNATNVLSNAIQSSNERIQAQISAIRNQIAESGNRDTMSQTELARAVYSLSQTGQRLAGTSLVKQGGI